MGKTSVIAFSPLPIPALLLVRSPKCCSSAAYAAEIDQASDGQRHARA
jgi:hypothetical protein